MDRDDLQLLAAAVVALVLIAGCYWLMTELTRAGKLEACLARRAKNCEQFAR